MVIAKFAEDSFMEPLYIVSLYFLLLAVISGKGNKKLFYFRVPAISCLNVGRSPFQEFIHSFAPSVGWSVVHWLVVEAKNVVVVNGPEIHRKYIFTRCWDHKLLHITNIPYSPSVRERIPESC